MVKRVKKGEGRHKKGARLERRIGELSCRLGLWGRMRIGRRVALSGRASRREAEGWVRAGRVRDGKGEVIDEVSTMVDEGEEVVVDGEVLAGLGHVRMWRFYKPRGCVTTNRDHKGRRKVSDYFPEALKGMKVVGRLDYGSEGLMLVTDNGELSRLLEHPDQGCERVYRVRVHGELPLRAEEELGGGIEVEGVRYRGITLEREGGEGRNRWVRMVCREGKNREIRKVVAYYGCEVARLVRLGYGGVGVEGLEVGEIKELGRQEVYEVLKSLVERKGKGV